MSELLKLTGLWAAKAKDGSTYYSGNLGAARLIIFKNKFKRGEKDPDLNLFIAPKPEAEAKPRTDAPAETIEDKEIPF